jgi:hypothetical protein
VPTATVVTTAFIRPARLAARSLQVEDLPLIVTPHPLNDLEPAHVEALARAVYPLVILHLTGQGILDSTVHAPFEHPAGNAMTSGTDPEGGAR